MSGRERLQFEDVIRTAVLLGGDCDTLTCIAGGIAEAYYSLLPDEMESECFDRMTPEMKQVVYEFNEARGWLQD